MSSLPLLDRLQQLGGRLSVEVDARHRRTGALEDHVFGLLDVETAGAQLVEHVRQHAGTIAVPHDQAVRRRRTRREIHDVRDPPGFRVDADDAHGFGGDGLLRLFGGRADVMRAVDVRERGDRRGEGPRTSGWLVRKHVEARADTARPHGLGQRGVVDDLCPRRVDEE